MKRESLLALGVVVAVGVAAGVAAWAAAPVTTAAALDSANVRVAETALGDVVADAVRTQTGAEVALVHAGMFLDGSLTPGAVTSDALRSVLFAPDEPLVVMDMPGSTLQAALERGLSYLPRPAPAFLQVSGLSVTFRSTSPANRRVESVQVGAAPLSPEKTYRVAMPKSLATGGSLGYYRIFGGLQPQQTGRTLSEAVLHYAQAGGNMGVRLGTRLRDLTPKT